MTMSRIYPSVCLLMLLTSLLVSCDQTTEVPDNPFDSIVFPDPPVIAPPPDSASITGLHQYIFIQSCAVPGCHDGHFEPDFRTVQSSYNSLVFQPVIKNTVDETYEWRVFPGDASESWLYNRVTTDDQILGRMPLYDNPLSPGQLAAIKTWIEDGAKDLFGNPAIRPNTQPQITSMAAYININGFPVRIDTVRNGNPSNPFGTLSNRDMTVYIGVDDDSTTLENLEDMRILFSDNWDDFSTASTIQMSYSASPQVVQNYYGPGQPESFHWSATFNTGQFPVGEVTYMRLKVNDGAHAEDYEFPDDPHPFDVKLFLSFFVVQ